MSEELLAHMEMDKIINQITEEWRQRIFEIMFTRKRYKNIQLMDNLVALADEAARAQIRIHEDFAQKVCALLELEERKQSAENSKTAIN